MNTPSVRTLLILTVLLVSLPFTTHAQTPSTPQSYETAVEEIESYHTALEVHTDSSVRVTETIVYNFASNQKHGIYRDVPVRYTTKSGTIEELDLQDISVTDENGTPYHFTTSHEGDNERIKVGDSDVLISGVHTYVITYRVPGVVGFFDSYDEIYWNAIGTEWPVPINNASAEIILPFEVPSSGFGIACYTGYEGANTSCDSHSVPPGDTYSHIQFAQASLAPGEGLTVAAGFPKGLVTEPPRPWWWPLRPYIPYAFFLLPILAFIFQYRRWQRVGRDPKGTGVIVPQYEAPDGLSPMQIAFLLNETFDQSLSAEIIYLATKGYLKIDRIEKKVLFITTHDYQLTKLKDEDAGLTAYQRELFTNLFSTNIVTLSSLENQFYTTAQEVEGHCEDSMVDQGYFPPRKRSVSINGVRQSTYTTTESRLIATMVIGFGIFISIFTGSFVGSSLAGFATFSAFLIFGAFEIIMPHRTEKGVLTREKVQGFKLYLSVAEKDRINFHDAPEKSPEVFQKFLPYAMALGVVDAWAKVFEGITLPAPSWYNDPSMTGFNSAVFASHMSSFAETSSSSLTSAPGSSSGSGGGGFSGGGGGGGGGGSW